MKKPIALLLMSLAPALALAAGDHQGGHAMHGDPQASAVGQAGKAADVTRTVEVSMDDSMRFVPDKVTVKAGETVRFFLKNVGKVPHEMVIGSMAELKEHAEMMRKFPTMEHEEPNMITLKPRQRGGLIWKFDQPGSVDFACLVPGHMEAGMIGKVTVSK
ncbi:cupredoxin family protein [Accumulibacter sp.]|uniref:cupredoxin domain-containing protein n=1 Tax=Accumulibacter sp. TaxID=2053492 RepID=UPI0028C465B3|nr:cupredoxin family protein [Accumulibacter sp.]